MVLFFLRKQKKRKENKTKKERFWRGAGGPGRGEMLTWDIVNIAAVHEAVAVLGVAERRQVGGIGGTGSDVTPKAACQRERNGHGHRGGRDGHRAPGLLVPFQHQERGVEGVKRSVQAGLGKGQGSGRVRGGERGLDGVRGEAGERKPGCLQATALAPWTAQCPR